MRTHSFRALACCLLLAGPPASHANAPDELPEGVGVVIGVIDGDTIDVLLTAEVAMSIGLPRRKNPVPIRLRIDQVDAPERGAPWWNRSKQALSDLIFGQQVRFRVTEVDRYDRAIAEIFLGDLWVNTWMIENGHGWAFRRFASQPTLTCALEEQARTARRGLWSQPPETWVPPWEWRRQVRVADAETPPTLERCLAEATRR